MIIERNVALHDKNWFGTGGVAHYFAEPGTGTEFQEALAFAENEQMPLFVLGQGANLLVHDDGVAGLVIRPQLKAISFGKHGTVTAGAGVTVHELTDVCLAKGLVGLEEFSGIPGSVGGSVYINIHYFEFLLSAFLTEATVINRRSGELLVVDNAWFGFGYNESRLQTHEWYLVDATFQLTQVLSEEAAFARGRRAEMIRHREKRYPAARTCGSFFRNFIDEEMPFLTNGKKVLNVAYFLEKVGVKGVLRVGNAIVTHQHANMLVTLPGATSADVVELARQMQQLVFDAYGVTPVAECQFVGFSVNPLLTR